MPAKMHSRAEKRLFSSSTTALKLHFANLQQTPLIGRLSDHAAERQCGCAVNGGFYCSLRRRSKQKGARIGAFPQIVHVLFEC
jgi:hypothetical protein